MSKVPVKEIRTLRGYLDTFSEEEFPREEFKVPEELLDNELLSRVNIYWKEKHEDTFIIIDNGSLLLFNNEHDIHYDYNAYSNTGDREYRYFYLSKILDYSAESLKEILDHINYKKTREDEWNIIYKLYKTNLKAERTYL
jgi:hypothetical protein